MHSHPHIIQHSLFAHIFVPLHSLQLLCGSFATLFSAILCLLLGSLWISDRHRVFYITPVLMFWFIVVSSIFQLFSFLDRFSQLPPTPTKFHHHLCTWIHSTLVTSGSQSLPPHFGGATHHGFHPKYPLKIYQTGHWMTCHPLWLPLPSHPSSTYFSCLGPVAHTLHSWLTRLLVREGDNRHEFQPKFGTHQPKSLPQHSKAFLTTSNLPKGLAQNSPYIDPNPTTKGPDMYMPFVPTNSTEQNSSKFSHPHSLSKEDQQKMIQAKAHTTRHLQAL